MDDFQTLVDFENLYNSYRTSMRGKGKKLSAAKFDVMALENLYVMKKQLINHTYRISPYSEFIVTEPKKRIIKSGSFRDKVLQHCLCDYVLFPTMKSLDSDKKPSGIPKTKDAVVEEKIDFSKVKVEPLFEEYVDFETFSKSDFRAVKVKACEAVKKSKKLLQFTLDDGTGTDRTILSGIHAYYEPEELVGKTLIAITNLPPRAMMGIDSCGMLLSAVHEEEGEEKLHLLMVDNHIPAGAKLY